MRYLEKVNPPSPARTRIIDEPPPGAISSQRVMQSVGKVVKAWGRQLVVGREQSTASIESMENSWAKSRFIGSDRVFAVARLPMRPAVHSNDDRAGSSIPSDRCLWISRLQGPDRYGKPFARNYRLTERSSFSFRMRQETGVLHTARRGPQPKLEHRRSKSRLVSA